MSNKILVALDGSDGSKRALSAAVAHAKLTNSVFTPRKNSRSVTRDVNRKFKGRMIRF
jgi:nucleotide-binding universal stress UspA family protein